MELQTLLLGFPVPNFRLSNHRPSSHQLVYTSHVLLRNRRLRLASASELYLMPTSKSVFKEAALFGLNRGTTVCASNSDTNSNLNNPGRGDSGVALSRLNGVEPFRGKSGSVSFYGLTHQVVEEGKLMSAPFQEDKGSFLWLLAPVALISSLILPQFFLSNAIDTFFKNETLIEIVASFSFEVIFYIGLGMFLLVTDHVQRPYLQFSPKRWGLISGLRGYLTSAFFTMGLKVIAPLFAVYVTWPVLRLEALIAVAPFLVGCAAQLAFEKLLDRRQSSCWPLVPIIFEVYRLYQLTRSTHFIQKLMYLMKDAPTSPEMMERGGALIGMLVTFQVLGVVCLWSLITFLLRLFPSRPVAENY